MTGQSPASADQHAERSTGPVGGRSPATSAADDQRRRWAQLDARVGRLERAAVRSLGVVTSVLLLIGSFLPFATVTVDGEPRGISLVLAAFTGVDVDDSADVLFMIGFLGLVACVGAAVLVLLTAPVGREVRGPARFGRVVFVLLAIGTVVPLIMTGVAAGSRTSSEGPGPALWVFVPGVVMYGYFVYGRVVDELRRGE